jgi:hypothetical protein
VNWRLDSLGGSLGHFSTTAARAVITAPLANHYGVQLDLQAGTLGGDKFGSAVGRVFWRDPQQALLGLYVSHTAWDRFGGVNVTQVAPEFELYWGRFTLRGVAGVEFGSSTYLVGQRLSTTIVDPLLITTFEVSNYEVKSRFFDQVDLKYYFTDSWNGYVGHRYAGGRNAVAFGTEFQLPANDRVASLFAEGRVGSGNFEGIWGGLKLYFGQSEKSLIRRDREDTVQPWDTLFSIVNNFRKSTASTSCPNSEFNPGSCETF